MSYTYVILCYLLLQIHIYPFTKLYAFNVSYTVQRNTTQRLLDMTKAMSTARNVIVKPSLFFY